MSFHKMKKSIVLIGSGCLLAITMAACAPAAEPAVSTRAPAPTFTPTPVTDAVQVDPNAVAATTAALAADSAPATDNDASAPVENSSDSGDSGNAAPEPVATEPPAPEPTATPAPQVAEAVINIQLMNVRSGPGVTYALVGGANQGERFEITGKDPTGAWWEVNYNGQNGWLFGELVTVQNVENVAVALNIPPSPVPPTPVPVVPTAVPPTPVPAAPTAPPEPPKPQYEFNVAVVGKCEPQAAGTWFSGKTYKNGEPKNGYRVVFSYAPDGPPVTNPIMSGPHAGYEGWDTGYYSHIIAAPGTGPKAGNWHVWIVNDGGVRISEIGSFTTDGDANTCNQAVVDFDSR